MSNRSVISTFIAIVFVLFSLIAEATDDTYLEMLEGESEDLQLDQKGQIHEDGSNNSGSAETQKSNEENETRPHWESGDYVLSDTLLPELPEKDFAGFIKKNFYGTYVYFKKLNGVDQRTIYYHYKKNKSDIETVRKDILDHLKN